MAGLYIMYSLIGWDGKRGKAVIAAFPRDFLQVLQVL